MRYLILAILLALLPARLGAQFWPYDPSLMPLVEALEAKVEAGDWEGAVEEARALVEASARVHGEFAVQTLEARHALATQTGNIAALRPESLAMFRALVADWARHHSTWHPSAQDPKMGLAMRLTDLGAPQEALPIALDALGMIEAVAGKGAPKAVLWRYNVAGIYVDLGYWVEGLAAYEITARDLRALGDRMSMLRLAVVERERGRLLRQLGRGADAVAAYAVALELFETHYGTHHPRTIDTMNEYALELWRERMTDPLGRIVIEAAARAESTFGPESIQVLDAQAISALMRTRAGPGASGFDEGLALMGDTVALASRLFTPGVRRLGELRLDYAAMLIDVGRGGEALEQMRGAERADVNSRGTYYDAIVAAEADGTLSPEAALAEAFRIAQESHLSGAAQAYRQLARRVVADDPAKAEAYRRTTDLIRSEAALQAELVARLSLAPEERDTAAETALRARLEEIATEVSAGISAQADTDAAFADLAGNGVLALDDVQALLSPDQAVVLIDTGAQDWERSFIFAVTRDRAVWREMAVAPGDLALAVADAREGVETLLGVRAAVALDAPAPVAGPGFNAFAAHWLYRRTLGEVADVIGDKPHLLIETRGALSGLPPQMLLRAPFEGDDLSGADWLVRHHAISILPSVFSLKSAALAGARARAPNPIMALADPVFETRPGGVQVASLGAGQGALRGALAPLPETATEARAVATALGAGPEAVLTGPRATRAAVQGAALDQFRVLYFATHGLVAGDRVQDGELAEPALALTADGDDGMLTQTDIARLRVNADWVVLSACNTAVGDSPGAEPLSGLAQAFVYAGARALLVSHWPVESRSAVRLMTETFRISAETPGITGAEAQRRAILSMIDSPPDARWSHPAYWAPFVLVGSPD
ncbi:MAG: CHAT domain-containing protein [Paracoccaceae bacterium]|nr:MAG: CHAT domain-containing protein [Paracoccaceae bacterium]